MSHTKWFFVFAAVVFFDLLSNSIFVFGTFAKKSYFFPGLSKLQRRFNFSVGAREEKNDEKEEKNCDFFVSTFGGLFRRKLNFVVY